MRKTTWCTSEIRRRVMQTAWRWRKQNFWGRDFAGYLRNAWRHVKAAVLPAQNGVEHAAAVRSMSPLDLVARVHYGAYAHKRRQTYDHVRLGS